MTKSTPFSKVLVANRGEIAMRVMRAARQLGYRTVAVYSDADAQAPHVEAADEAVRIGGPLPAQSYLDVAALVAAAKTTGADAVHPGYGFLAESEAFAQACTEAGLVFIGPSADAIRIMGSKSGAKRLMESLDVPCVPGYQGEDQGDGRLAAEADRIGYPLMIKATAGGGGRGMRLVTSAASFPELLRSARSEALHAFGDGAVILERAIAEPRHIEIQVLADRLGNVVHLGERDCSVQRRHQKVIEEAPSPAVSAELRARMGAVATRAVKAIGYEGAGTLEFLLDGQGNFYFMEMNTRLQVEHPVTEAVTGLDLVELQLLVAAGEPLPLRQDDVRFHGHAIEVRLCAEDAAGGFMPQSGTVAMWEPTRRLRVEHALRSGAEVPAFYDSMIAKFVSHGRTRSEAVRKLAAGLRDSVALGVRTNKAFLARCLEHPEFEQGLATTAFIGRHADALVSSPLEDRHRAHMIAAVLLLETSPGARQRLVPRQLPNPLPITLRLDADGELRIVSVQARTVDTYEVEMGDATHGVRTVGLDTNRARVALDGVIEHVAYVRDGNRLQLAYRGDSFSVEDRTRVAASRREEGRGADGLLRASMNGRVIGVFVALGDKVVAGQPVVTLEAMKMEHSHVSPRDGVVKALHVAVGDHVQVTRVVAEIAAHEASG